MSDFINVIGAGLAGCEAAWQIAERGIHVKLFEMKPLKKTPAHKYDGLCELVCSNSLRNNSKDSAIGLLKEELRIMNSLIMESADSNSVSAGGALAVDRYKFSDYITDKIRNNPNITLIEKECDSIPVDDITVIATGPLTSAALTPSIEKMVGNKGLSFFDAAAPIVTFDSIDMEKAFFASRYGKGNADYINCPMNKEEYDSFYRALTTAEAAELHDFEKGESLKVFEGCMPVEVMAGRGEETLRFGPLKPVGITNPSTGETYYAVVQLRRENEQGTMYNLVGFQTHLKFGEQKRVFSMIPGLENAEFVRYGVMHRNTFIDSPGFLDNDYSVLSRPNVFFAGQMTGVEGYIESCASGFAAGISAASKFRYGKPVYFPSDTMIGSMALYVKNGGSSDFQPMNANFGIVPPPDIKVKGGKRMRYGYYSDRALKSISNFLPEIDF